MCKQFCVLWFRFFENNIEMEVCEFAEECTEWLECMISIFTGLC